MTISGDQVRAWRLQRQFLDRRASTDAVEVISRLCGVQAQVTSSAEPGKQRIRRVLDGGG